MVVCYHPAVPPIISVLKLLEGPIYMPPFKRPIPTAVGQDWEEATSEFTQRCVFMDIIGLESSGKTFIALTAPGPLALIHNNEKVAGVVQEFVRKGKRIRVHKYGFTVPKLTENEKLIVATSKAATPAWNGLKDKLVDAQDNWARSLIADTGNGVWDTLRFARCGTLTPKGRADAIYGPMNAEFRSLIANRYRNQSKCNLITTHMMVEKWVDKVINGQKVGINTGDYKRSGFKEMPFMAEVVLRAFKQDGLYWAEIVKGWFHGEKEGTLLNDEILQALGYSGLNFPSIMAFITETPEIEWAV